MKSESRFEIEILTRAEHLIYTGRNVYAHAYMFLAEHLCYFLCTYQCQAPPTTPRANEGH